MDFIVVNENPQDVLCLCEEDRRPSLLSLPLPLHLACVLISGKKMERAASISALGIVPEPGPSPSVVSAFQVPDVQHWRLAKLDCIGMVGAG